MIAVLALIYAARAWLGYRDVRADAEADFAYRQSRNMRGAHLGRERFTSAFLRTHAPRAPKFMAIGLGAIVLATFPALRIMDLFMTLVWKLSGESRTFEPPFLVYQFGVFFGTIAIWAVIAYLAARAYHQGASVSFEQELLREEGLL